MILPLPGRIFTDGGSVPRREPSSPAGYRIPGLALQSPPPSGVSSPRSAPEIPYRGRLTFVAAARRHPCPGGCGPLSRSRVLSRAGTRFQRICRSGDCGRRPVVLPHPRISSGTSSTAAATHRQVNLHERRPCGAEAVGLGDGLTLNPEVPHGAPRDQGQSSRKIPGARAAALMRARVPA